MLGIEKTVIYPNILLIACTVMEQGRCPIVNHETLLDLTLRNLNAKIILYQRIVNRIPTNKLKHKFYMWKIVPIVQTRDEKFKELRILLKKKHPEMFIQ
jgi:hypothetical protein